MYNVGSSSAFPTSKDFSNTGGSTFKVRWATRLVKKGTYIYIYIIFCANIAKFKFNLLYRYCLKLIGERRKEKEFRQYCCRNSTKIGERKRKRWREKEEEFRQHCYRNSSPQIPARHVSCVLKKAIAAMPLPK